MENLRIHELRPCRYLFAISKERSNMLRSFGMPLCAQSTGHFCPLRHSFSIYFARWRAACLFSSNSGQRAGTLEGIFSGFESRGAQPPALERLSGRIYMRYMRRSRVGWQVPQEISGGVRCESNVSAEQRCSDRRYATPPLLNLCIMSLAPEMTGLRCFKYRD